MNQNTPSSLPNEDINWDQVRRAHRTGVDPKQAAKHEADIEKLDRRTAEEKGGQAIERRWRR
jgi:hypothetical protein